MERDLENKKNANRMKIILLVLVICISIGYAILRTELNIHGTATIPRVAWDVHFENVQNTQNCNVTPTSRTEFKSIIIVSFYPESCF